MPQLETEGVEPSAPATPGLIPPSYTTPWDAASYVRRSELETSVLFELICHRYERKSLLVTSNQPFWEWDEIFPSGSMTVAAVDRLVHHCHIVGIKGESYRQKAAAARVSSDQIDPPT